MAFSLNQIPQADILDKVVQTVVAINDSITLESEIADHVGISSKQVERYLHAAEILGFISGDYKQPGLTAFGNELINGFVQDQQSTLRSAVLRNNLFAKVLEEFKKNPDGLTENEIREFIFNNSQAEARTSIPRRIKTVLSWLSSVELIIEENEKYKFNDQLEDEQSEKSPQDGIYPVNYSKEVDIKEESISVFELRRKIENDKIIMNPDFQRHLVWKPHQKSQFIESIILNVPLPPFYLKKELNGKLIIIDGLQRTSTLEAFLNQEGDDYFPLEGLMALPRMNGKYFHQLDEDIRTRIEDKNLLIYVLQPTVPMVVVYDIFNRINTGGTQLERQEIRNCIFIGESTRLIKRLADDPDFKQAIDYGIAPTRMKDREAVLRCISFQICDYGTEYNNSLDDFLEKSMRKINRTPLEEIEKLELEFKRVMKMTFDFFGYNNFRLPTDYSRGRINIAVMESVYNFFANSDPLVLVKNKKAIKENFSTLLDDEEYYDAVRYSTGSKSKVDARFSIAKATLGNF